MRTLRRKPGAALPRIVTRELIRAWRARELLENLESRLLLSVNVTTAHYGNANVNVNSQEIILTPANVNTGTFGKTFSTTVDGQIYAQPLTVSGVTILGGSNTAVGAGGVHDVVYVATEADSLYAIDANTGATLWYRPFASATNAPGNVNNTFDATAITPLSNNAIGSTDISPSIGITGTPVIDAANNTLYVITQTAEVIGGPTFYVYRLHAISLSDGTDVVDPFMIGKSGNGTTDTPIYVYGTGYNYGSGQDGVVDPYNGTDRSVVQFNALRQNQRAGLSLVNGTLYAEWAAHGLVDPYHGWIVSWNVSDVQNNGIVLSGVLNTTPNAGRGGVWMGATPLAFEPDGSAFYFSVGNGNSPSPIIGPDGFPTNANYSDGVVKAALDPTTTPQNQGPNGWGIKIVDYFLPHDVANLDTNDSDLGSGGLTLLPPSAGVPGHPNLLIAGGKSGKYYVLDRDNLGHFDPFSDSAINSVPIAGKTTPAALFNGLIGGAAAYFNGQLYAVSGFGGAVQAYALSSNGMPTFASKTLQTNFGFNPGSPVISAHGVNNGILWMSDRAGNVLHAYNPSNLAVEYWNSSQAPGNVDAIGTAIKYNVPTVANGKVYIGTANALVAYGLKAAANAAPLPPVLTVATALSNAAILLNWTDPTPIPNTATGYTIQYSTNGIDFQDAAEAGAGTTSITIAGLAPATQYYFKIVGENPQGSSLESNIRSATTTGSASAIDFGTGFGAAASSLLQLNGSAFLNNSNALVLVNNIPGQAGSAWYKTQQNITQFTAQFTFSITGTWPLSNGLTFAIQKNLVTALGAGGQGLGYGASQANGLGGIPSSVALKFDVYNTTGNGAMGLYSNGQFPSGNATELGPLGINLRSYNQMKVKLVYDGTNLAVTLTDLTTNATVTRNYAIDIPAVIGSNDAWIGFTGSDGSQMSLQQIFNWTYSTSGGTIITSPSAPTGLANGAVTSSTIDLNWIANSSNQTGYTLERATNAAFTQNLVSRTLPATPAQFTDTGLNPATNYFYRVRAFNSAGASGNSNAIRVMTAALVPPPASAPTGLGPDPVAGGVQLSWNALAGATSYLVSYGTTPGGPYTTTLANIADASVTISGLSAANTYYFVVSAVNNGGAGPASGEVTAVPVVGAPGGLAASAANGAVSLTWNLTPGAATYVIRRSTSAGGTYDLVADNISGTVYSNTGLANETTYYYTVSAVGISGEGAASAPVSATPSAAVLTLNFSSGFATSASLLSLNGSAKFSGGKILLTDNHVSQAGSAFALAQQNISGFITQFDFQIDGTWPLEDGLTFVIQRAGVTALGQSGGGLGYGAGATGGTGGIPNSIAVKFDVYSNQGEGANSTGLYLNGAAPTNLGSINLDGTGFNMRSYNPSRATLVYDGTTLAVTIKDLVTNATVTQSYSVNIPAVIGGTNAWVGFTASTGSITSNNAILNWTFITTGPAPSSPPAAPTGLNATPGNGQVSLTWNPVATATSYTVKYGTATGVYTQTLPAATTSATVTGLTNGTPYFFVVSASNASGPGNNSAEATTTPTAPSIPVPAAPTGLVATPGNGQVSLTWNSVATATSYTVKYGTATGIYTQTLPAASTSATVTSLTNGTPYFFVVTASNGSGPSGNSAEASATPAAPPAPSGGIQFPTGFAGSAALLKLNGSAKLPGSDLILTDGLTSQVSSVYALEQQNIASFTTQFDFQITGTWPLGDGFTFVIQRSSLSAIGQGGGGLGYGAASTTGSGGIANSIAIKFDVYSNQGEGTNSTGLYLNGAAPTLNGVDIGLGGFNMRSYNLSRATMSYDGTTLTVTLKDLVTGATATQNYNVNISAVIGGSAAWIGFTAASGALTSVSRITNWVFTGAPASPPAAPTGLQATPGNEQVSLSWNAVPGASSYTVKYGSTPGVYNQTLAASGNSATITSLTNGTPYYFIVVAANGSGSSPDSAEATATPALALPAAPTGLAATAGNGQVSLAWDAVPGATSYTVRYGTVSGVMTTTVPVSITGSSHTVSGLTNGVTYYFVVSANNAAGSGPDSAQASATPGAATTTINYPSGFGAASSVFLLNGSARILPNGALALTDNHTSQVASAYFASQQNVSAFTTQFDFQTTGSWPLGEGFTFVIQRAAANAIGRDGGGLGYGAASSGGSGGIANSIAIKFDVASNQGEGGNSTGLYLNGAAPTGTGSINLDGTGVNLRSYNPSRAAITYDGTTLTVVLTDLVTGASATQNYNVNIPAVIGGSTAWVGFTASTGSQIANHTILNWTFSS